MENGNHINLVSLQGMVCVTMETTSLGAQTERPGLPWPKRSLLRGRASPAALVGRGNYDFGSLSLPEEVVNRERHPAAFPSFPIRRAGHSLQPLLRGGNL